MQILTRGGNKDLLFNFSKKKKNFFHNQTGLKFCDQIVSDHFKNKHESFIV